MINLALGIDLENALGNSGAAAGILRGAIAASGGIAAMLDQDRSLDGNISAGGIISGTANQSHALSGSVLAANSVTGNLAVSGSAPTATPKDIGAAQTNAPNIGAVQTT